jgi:hypothetical protein
MDDRNKTHPWDVSAGILVEDSEIDGRFRWESGPGSSFPNIFPTFTLPFLASVLNTFPASLVMGRQFIKGIIKQLMTINQGLRSQKLNL